MTKDEVLAFTSQQRLKGEIEKWSQPLRLFEDGTLRGESSEKGSHNPNPATGTGKWSVDEDGTFRLFLDWGRWGKHDWVGKLYRYEGYVYQFRDGGTGKTGYRFKL